MTRKMQVWRSQTNTSGGDVAEYCCRNNVAALSWALDEAGREKLRGNPSFKEYCFLADAC